MGIFEFLKKKQDKANEMGFADKSMQSFEPKEDFVADLSFVELQGADWKKFAGILKREGVLSNSYDKKPVSIEYSLDKDNNPVIELTFKSTTSDSVRKIQLFNDHACLYVNGALCMYPETQSNKDLNKLWKNYQYWVRYYNMREINHQGINHARRGARLLIEAEKMMDMKDIYFREQVFLEENKDARFDEFCYSDLFEKDKRGFVNYAGELPQFMPLKATEDGHYVSGQPVIPFTPRTLEHCILHMTNGQKVEDGENLIEFEKKCRKLQKYSCFESDDWDKVIEFGKEIVRNQYIASVVTNEKEI